MPPDFFFFCMNFLKKKSTEITQEACRTLNITVSRLLPALLMMTELSGHIFDAVLQIRNDGAILCRVTGLILERCWVVVTLSNYCTELLFQQRKRVNLLFLLISIKLWQAKWFSLLMTSRECKWIVNFPSWNTSWSESLFTVKSQKTNIIWMLSMWQFYLIYEIKILFTCHNLILHYLQNESWLVVHLSVMLLSVLIPWIRFCMERFLKFPVTWGTLCHMITKHL